MHETLNHECPLINAGKDSGLTIYKGCQTAVYIATPYRAAISLGNRSMREQPNNHAKHDQPYKTVAAEVLDQSDQIAYNTTKER